MNIRTLILNSLGVMSLCCASVNADAQQRLSAHLRRTAATQGNRLVSTVVTADDAASIAAQLQGRGFKATAISSTVLTARMPADELEWLGRQPGVSYVKPSLPMQPTMDMARAAIAADRAQAGDELDTPFTGRGVLIGIIDQGFEYRHIAFLDDEGQTRVKAVWNRWGYSDGQDSEPTTDIPTTSDGISGTGHATHVTGIAAGSRIAENDFCGIAPEADIVMIPSEFNEAEVLEDVKFIRDMAHERQQPWVINMSFGTMLGPHDGTTPSYQAIDELITAEPGGMIVAAVGNDGMERMHAAHTFNSDGETVRVAVKPSSIGVFIDVWSQTADSMEHVAVKPFVGTPDGQRFELGDDVIRQIMDHEIAPFNRKENYFIQAAAGAISSYGRTAFMGLELTADAGTIVHLWTSTGFGTLADGPDDSYLQPDNACTIYDPASSLQHGVAVSAFNSRQSYTSLSGYTQTINFGGEGQASAFSNRGPSLGDAPRPTVAAPGAMIVSSLSKYETGFNKSANHVVGDVRRGLKHFYYGAYYGTSMAAPMVTGSIALWLQANPSLTHGQIHDIIRLSARHDEFTGDDAWSPQWGYGKLDTYEGLKLALRMTDTQGVTAPSTLTEPLTILHQDRQWRLLLNNDEPQLDITIADEGGRTLSRQTLRRLHRGDEHLLPLSHLPYGTYIVSIRTPRAQIIRKLIR